MAYRAELGPKEALGPAWVELDPAKLPRPALERLKARLGEGVLGRVDPPRLGPSSTIVVVMALAILGGVALALFRVGIVVSVHAASPLFASFAYGVITAIVVRGAFALRARRKEPSFSLMSGRLLVPAGVIEAVGERVRVAGADRIASIELSGGAFFSYFRVRLDDGTVLELPALGRRASSDGAQAIETVLARGVDIRHARSLADRQQLDRLELVARADLEQARVPPRKTRAQRPWRVASVVGALVAGLAYGAVLPVLAIGWTPHDASIDRWSAIARAYPFPWVTSRARAAIAERRQHYRELILARLAPSQRDAWAAVLDWLAANDTSSVMVDVRPPPAAEVAALTEALRALAPAGAELDPVDLAIPASLAYAYRPGAPEIVERVGAVLQAPIDVIELQPESTYASDEASEPEHACLVIELRPRVAGVLEVRDGTFAALELTLHPRIEIPGATPWALGDPIVVPAPDVWALLVRPEHVRFWSETSPASEIAYAREIERAAQIGGDALANRMRRRD